MCPASLISDATDWIRRARRHRGLTQAALSAEAGVSLATLQNIEAGSANPSLKTLERLFAVLDLTWTVRPAEADWDRLASLGLPLASTAQVLLPPAVDELPGEIRNAALELTEAPEGAAGQRKRESLQALLLALRHHFPRVYRGWFERAPLVTALLPDEPSGRHIKLARMARARLAEIL